ncbi:MAG: carboxypeptidase regulatory-like domain-containing protein [Bryobacterales bacterium]|nr:carboxypeptidase regulatory-like domain-containing protein [Bryobacterales bacterium]
MNLANLCRILCILALAASAAWAQVTTGTILGVVTDTTGAAVSAATVTITETSKNTTSKYQTDEAGLYNAPFLVPGVYSVTVEKDGFKKAIQTNVALQVDQKARTDFTLAVGSVSETVEVTAAAPLVRSESAELGEVIGTRAVRELPLNGRNFAQLVYLNPGVTPGQAGENLSGASTFNPRGPSNFNALGSRANTNAWLVDGIDNNEFTFNTVVVAPTVESVREFKTLTGVFSAEFGRGAGVVSVSTQSGSNDFHGNVFEFHRNHELDARNVFAPANQRKPVFRQNQYGLAIGGPVLIPKLYNGKNRTFFFFDYAALRTARGIATVNTVPTAQTRAGDFSQVLRDANLTIYNPLTTRVADGRTVRDPYPGNIMPAAAINSVGRNVASIYPLPNAPGRNGGLFDNYISVPNREVKDNVYTGRFDQTISTTDSLFFRYTYNAYNLTAPQGQANCCLPTPADAASRFTLGPYVAGLQDTQLTTQGSAFNWTHIFKPNLLHEFRAGFARTNPLTTQQDIGINAATSLGIRNINLNRQSSGIPTINVTDITGLSGGPAFLPVNPLQTHYQLDSAWNWTVGKHTIKFGWHIVQRKAQPFVNEAVRGNMNFTRAFTNNPQSPANSGFGLATLLTGYMNSGARSGVFEPFYLNIWENSLYLQDDIKVNRRLTVNLGVRHEVFRPETEKYDRLPNWDLRTLSMLYSNENGVSRSAGKRTNWKNFGPRIGMAYDITGNGKTILRSGYSLVYFPDPVTANGQIGLNVPIFFTQSLAFPDFPLTMNGVATIDNPFPLPQAVKPRTPGEINGLSPAPRLNGHSLDNRTPYMQTWTANIQRQVTQSLMVEADYAGSTGMNLAQSYNPNEVQPGPGALEPRRLLQPLNRIPNIFFVDWRARSSFHSMQLKATKRYENGLQFLAAYTWGKSLDYTGSVGSGGGQTGGPQTVTCLDCNRGPSGFDVRHRAVINYVWDLPFGKGRKFANSNAVARRVAGGWQVSGITTLTTGRPFNINLAAGVNNGAPSWPNRLSCSGKLDNPAPDRWFDPSCFAAPAAFTYGNAGRGILYSPGNVNFDTSFVKNNRFGAEERLNVQFRFEAYNLFNSPYFGFPNGSIGSPTAGRITTTVGENRSLQLALKFEF